MSGRLGSHSAGSGEQSTGVKKLILEPLRLMFCQTFLTCRLFLMSPFRNGSVQPLPVLWLYFGSTELASFSGFQLERSLPQDELDVESDTQLI